jgi:hypothetical protein
LLEADVGKPDVLDGVPVASVVAASVGVRSAK